MFFKLDTSRKILRLRDCGTARAIVSLVFTSIIFRLRDCGSNSFTRLTLIIIPLVYHVHFSFNKPGNSFRGYKITVIFTIYKGVTTALCFSQAHKHFQTPALWAASQYYNEWQFVSRSLAQRFSGLRAGGLNAVRPFFSLFFFPPAWNVLQLSTRFVRLSFWKKRVVS